MVSVRWSDSALQGLDELDSPIRERILTKVSWLQENIGNIVLEPLHRELRGQYKLRVGDYRAVYSVRGDIIVIEEVGHRCDIYR